MGGSSKKQTVGHKYYASFFLVLGNVVETFLGINFDKRGWLNFPLVESEDDHGYSYISAIEQPNLYGENEGGVEGIVYVRKGSDNKPVPVYESRMNELGFKASVYPYQSYLVFKDFYLGNSGYMKEMLLHPKRIHIKNNGDDQWYDEKSEIGSYKWEDEGKFSAQDQSKVTVIPYYKFANNSTNYVPESWDDDHFVTPTGEVKWNEDEWDFFPNSLSAQMARSFAYAEPNGDDVRLGASFEVRPFGDGFLEIEISIVVSNKGIPPYILGSFIELSREYTQGSAYDAYKFTGVWDASEAITIHTYSDRAVIDEGNQWSIGSVVSINLAPKEGVYPYEKEGEDINIIHKIREVLTDDTALNKSEDLIDDGNFALAANVIFDEKLGISWALSQKPCLDALNELAFHGHLGIRQNRQTGLYQVVLFRDDWDVAVHELHQSKIKSIELSSTNSSDLINKLNVKFYDRANIKDSAFSVYDHGSILTCGFENSQDISFPYFMNFRNAEKVAQWKLKELSTPKISGTLTTGYKQARAWNRYDIINLNWPQRSIVNLPVRITSINLGNGVNNEVSIDFEEVVSVENSTSITISDEGISNKPEHAKPNEFQAFELPYYFAVLLMGQSEVDLELNDSPDVGFVSAVAIKPQNNSLNALLYTDEGSPDNALDRASVINYGGGFVLSEPISRVDSILYVSDYTPASSENETAYIYMRGEIMQLVSYSQSNNTIVVKRGVLDTVPIASAQETRGFIFNVTDIGVDPQEYYDGESVSAISLTTTPSSLQDIDSNLIMSIELQSRAFKPYPPANVEINNSYFPESIIISAGLVVEWSHRNRVQQTGGEPLSWYDSSVTPENGVTYSYELKSGATVVSSDSGITTNTIMIEESDLIPNTAHTLTLWSVRDGLDSYQKYQHSFFVEGVSLILTATATSTGLTGNTLPIADIGVDVDESLKANMRYDGSKIYGKAEAGAEITIEVDE